MASSITLQRSINLAQQFIRQAPLTFSSLYALGVNSGGSGYGVGDTISVLGTGTGGTALVSSISGGGSTGPVTGLIILIGGARYLNGATGVLTSGGSGSGLTVNTQTFSDPALANADWVKQFILSPPFAWRWNRYNEDNPSDPTFTTNIGISDYSVPLENFGWLEKATGYNPRQAYEPFELQVQLIKATDTIPNQPTRISAQYEDDSGNVTFRLFPTPDAVYNIVVEYQYSATLFTDITNTWSPIPDYLSYLYNEGFQAKAYEYAADPRFLTAMQIFMQDLAANSEGLNESQKNLWLDDRLNTLRQTQVVQGGR